ncbi:DUF4145 domain-containing protein [Bradyrhizobium sp. SZCCHNRI3043]|uniref:DUF4145 domain-containing protein n=1 Tax=Bradyrhizobium sp. SZCCHNRI3043 TaxID=3057292 RepID=UPI0028E53080|nr:DUF4145 domain-containing protein [Bradyrhizobium sp. SZCCHNRI3043]
MAPQHIEPALGLASFNCPTCGALAQQFWFKPFCDHYTKDQKPYTLASDVLDQIRSNAIYDSEMKRTAEEFFRKRLSKKPFFEQKETHAYLNLRLENCEVSRCYSCNSLAIWVYDQLAFPHTRFASEPNFDLDDDIKLDFLEAAKIVDLSPRGAAALLRLCVQKICIQLGEPGKNIDTDISSLVKKGLEPAVQQALDIVRVIGNEAVHPGQIDLRDDRDTALKLFRLINIIAEAMISRPKQIAELYSSLPPTKLQAIEKRDLAKPKKA